MSRLFGTDGVRGVANTELSPELVFNLGFFGAKVLARNMEAKPRFVVGRDTRLSGTMLEAALCAGLCAAGADAYLAGVIPTPGIAYLTANKGFDFGVVISASHNPYEFNGIKFFNNQGYKLSDAEEDEIAAYILGTKEDDHLRPTKDGLGQVYTYSQAADTYLTHLRYAMGLDLDGMKLALDCANGAAFDIAPRLFKQLGAEVVVCGDLPNGTNINDGCGSTNLCSLQKLVLEQHCDLGIAYDGDTDRMLAIDSEGEVIDGDIIMAILARYLRSKNRLAKDTLVITVMSNLGLNLHAKEQGLNIEATKVGDRYVLEAMLANGYNFGGEQSGHFIMLDYATTGDGILSSLALLKALRKANQTLAEAKKIMTVYPQVLLGTKVANELKSKVMNAPKLQAKIADIQALLGDNGRVLVRASGTEPLIRVMIEGQNQEEIKALAKNLVSEVNAIVQNEDF